eukprot:1115666-Rhodomonas_salina.1
MPSSAPSKTAKSRRSRYCLRRNFTGKAEIKQKQPKSNKCSSRNQGEKAKIQQKNPKSSRNSRFPGTLCGRKGGASQDRKLP